MAHLRKTGFEAVRPILVWVLIIGLAAISFCLSPPGQQLELEVFRKINFWFRARVMQMPPRIDPRIRVFAFDDQTAGLFQKYDFRLRDWVKILRVMAEKRPASIFIDKIWSMPVGDNFDLPLDQAQADQFIEQMRTMQVPVTVGGSIFEKPVFKRQPMDLSRPEFDLRKMWRGGENFKWGDQRLWRVQTPGLLFGPQQLIAAGFSRIGQLDYPGAGRIHAMVRIDEQHLIPHAALLATGMPIQVDESGLSLGTTMRVPLDDSGHIPVNFNDPAVYNGEKLTKSLAGFISKANRNALTDEILAGDYVVILPSMFTGNVDWAMTPVGNLQGGFVPTAVINSALTNQWLRPLGGDVWLVAFACALAGILAVLLPTVLQIPVLLLSCVVMAAAGLVLFAMYGIVVNWGTPILSFALTGIFCFFERARLREFQSRRLREALEGTVPPERMAEILKPGALLKDPSEQVVTIMFIDMVGFSLTAEKLTPKVAFDDLKHHLGVLTEMIHAHGGVIDKFLGDGILCFFGYSFTVGSQVEGHAEAAVRCAIEIQRTWQNLSIQSQQTGSPIYPLRIGINTAASYIGDVGRGHVHFTMIGQGVNFASRLESTCEPYKIMLGEATAEMLPNELGLGESLQKRLIQIKHHDELFDAYEIDPFFDRPQDLAAALSAYRKSVAIERRDQRFPIVKCDVWMDFGVGSAKVINFSCGGFAIESNVYPATGVRTKAEMFSSQTELNDALRASGLLPLIVEVRWGYTMDSGVRYRLGIEVKSLNDQQLERLMSILKIHTLQQPDEAHKAA